MSPKKSEEKSSKPKATPKPNAKSFFSEILPVEKLEEVIRRFPVTVGFLFISTAYWLYLSTLKKNTFEHFEIFATLFMGIFIFMPVYLFLERRPELKRYNVLIHVLTFLFLASYYFFIKQIPDYKLPYIFSVSLFLPISSLFIIPVYGQTNDTVARHTVRLVGYFDIVMLYSALLFIGVVVALAIIRVLFNGHFNELMYFRAWLVLAGLYAPLLYLTQFPRYGKSAGKNNGKDWEIPPNLVFQIKYILTPLSVLYFLILYLYFLRITLLWEMPKGVVSTMVLVFSLGGMMVHLITWPFRGESKIFNLIHRFQYVLIMPLLVLLGLAVWLRVREYGITEQRYLLALGGCWIFSICLYMLVSGKKSVMVLFTSSAIILFLSAVGPWSMFNVSIHSQIKRLVAELRKNKQFDAKGNWQPSVKKAKDRGQILKILEYLEDRNELDSLKKKIPLSKPMKTRVLLSTYGQIRDKEKKYFSLNSENINSLRINGAQYYIHFVYYQYANDQLKFTTEDKKFTCEYLPKEGLLVIKGQKNTLVKLNLNSEMVKRRKQKKAVIPFSQNSVSGLVKINWAYGYYYSSGDKPEEISSSEFDVFFGRRQ